MATIRRPQDLEEEELLLLQETAATNGFSHLHLSNHPPCPSCASAPAFSHKRPSSENPTTHHQPNPKKPNNTTHSKIPLSSPSFLRRCSSDPYNPPLPPVVEEPSLSPQPNAELDPRTPLSNAIASSKLPPRPPTLKRSVSDPIPSPAKTFSTSSDSPHSEWLRKMRDCMREMSRKWDELFGDEEDNAIEEIKNDSVNNENNNDATMDNSEEGYVETVSVEEKGETLILHFKCPCGTGYQILLFGGNCYYKLM